MAVAITRRELGEISTQMPKGDLRDWCELSANGPPGQVVYADSSTLKKCRAAMKKKGKRQPKQNQDTTEPSSEKESEDEDVQG